MLDRLMFWRLRSRESFGCPNAKRTAHEPYSNVKQPIFSLSSPGLTGRSSIPEMVVLSRDVSGILDAPLSLSRGMTAEDVTSHSRGMICPSLAKPSPSKTQRAQGKPGRSVHPQPRVQ
jgi:hypothetical protein